MKEAVSLYSAHDNVFFYFLFFLNDDDDHHHSLSTDMTSNTLQDTSLEPVTPGKPTKRLT